MLLEDVKNRYGSFYKFCVSVGYSYSAPTYWKKLGYIPIKAQKIIEIKTDGGLRADFNHTKEFDKCTKE